MNYSQDKTEISSNATVSPPTEAHYGPPQGGLSQGLFPPKQASGTGKYGFQAAPIKGMTYQEGKLVGPEESGKYKDRGCMSALAGMNLFCCLSAN